MATRIDTTTRRRSRLIRMTARPLSDQTLVTRGGRKEGVGAGLRDGAPGVEVTTSLQIEQLPLPRDRHRLHHRPSIVDHEKVAANPIPSVRANPMAVPGTPRHGATPEPLHQNKKRCRRNTKQNTLKVNLKKCKEKETTKGKLANKLET